MNLKEMSFDRQVECLKSLMRSGENTLPGHFALFAFRHHLASRHSPAYTVKPVSRWYLGQLAKMYIQKYFKEAKATLQNLNEIGLLDAKEGQDKDGSEYHLDEALYPALRDVLEEVFGKEHISRIIERAKFYRNPGAGRRKGHIQNGPEVEE